MPGVVNKIAKTGQVFNISMALQNTGLNNDTYDLSFANDTWPVSFLDATGTTPIASIGPVGSFGWEYFTVRVTVPGTAVTGDFDEFEVNATSQNDTAISEISLVNVTCFNGIAVGIYDHPDVSDISYWTDGNGNSWADYQGVVDSDLQGRFMSFIITELSPWTLELLDVIVLPDNAIPDADLAAVNAWFLPGKGIIAVDSAACFATYSGYMFPAGAGTNGNGVYWDYNTNENDQCILMPHKITESYEINDIYSSMGGDAQYYNSMLPLDALALTTQKWNSEYVYAVAREVPGAGRIVGLGPYDSHPDGTDELIRDAIEWSASLGYYSVVAQPGNQEGYGSGGETVDFTVTVLNTGTSADTYDLTATGSVWTAEIYDATGTTVISSIGPISAGASADFIVRVSIPGGSSMGAFDEASIHIESQSQPSANDTATVRTQVPYVGEWFDGLESGMADWTVDDISHVVPSTTWETGDPTGYPPISPYDGTSCAGTNLLDYYYIGADTVLESPYLTLEAGGVLLSEEFGSGTMPPAGWSHIPNNAYTWFIETNTPHSAPYYADCQYDPALNTQDEWLISPPLDLTGCTGTELRFWWYMSYYWGVNPYDNYDLNVYVSTNDWATSTFMWNEDGLSFSNWVWYDTDMGLPLDLSAFDGMSNVEIGFQYSGADGAELALDDITVTTTAGSCNMSFFQWYDIDTNDGGFVEISVDNGPWTQIDPVAGYPVTGNAGGYVTNCYAGASGAWYYEVYDVSSYVGSTVRFGFHFASETMNSNWGWYIDDAFVGGTPYSMDATPPLQAGFGDPGDSVFYTVDVSNTGYIFDTYDLSVVVNTTEVWFYDLGMSPITSIGSISAGSSASFIVEIVIPGANAPGAWDGAVIQATSQNDLNVFDQCEIITQTLAQFLLVDDDGGLITEMWYDQAFVDNGWAYDYWNTGFMGVPSASVLALFDAVVWGTGDNSGGYVGGQPFDTLSVDEMNEITTFLDNGGRMYLSSAGCGADAFFNGWDGWLGAYFGAFPYNLDVGTSYELIGEPYDLIGDGLDYFMHQGDADPEVQGILGMNAPFGAPTSTAWIMSDMGDFAAIKTPTFTYRTVLSGYEFADIDGQANRAMTLSRIINWLLLPDYVLAAPSYQEYAAGADTTVIYPMTITNLGMLDDTFDLSIAPAPLWTTEIRDETGTIVITDSGFVPGGSMFNFTIAVQIPIGAVPSYSSQATLNVSSQNQPGVYALADVWTYCYVTPPTTDDFEGGTFDSMRAMTFGNITTQWEQGDPSSFPSGPGSAYSGANCWGTNLLANYTPGTDSCLYTHYYNLSLAQSANMTFWQWYSMDPNDGGWVEISTDFTQTWTQIRPVGGYGGTNWYGIESYLGTSGGWQQGLFNLSDYVGKVVILRFKFASTPMTPITFAGWYIDDVSVDAILPTRGVLVSPASAMQICVPGANADYQLTVKNIGTSGDDTFDLTAASSNGWPAGTYDLGMNPISSLGPLAYGASENIIVRLTVPLVSSPGQSDDTLVTATSQNDSAANDTALLTSQVLAPILLVDDDLGIMSQSWYESALTDSGFAFNKWDVSVFGAPALGDLAQYDGVVWLTGNAYGFNGNSLTFDDRVALGQYMAAGGNVYLSGSMVPMEAHDYGWEGWLSNYFGAAAVNASMGSQGWGWEMFGTVPQSIEGVAGDPIGDGMTLAPHMGDYCPALWGTYTIMQTASPMASYSFNFNPGLPGGTEGAMIRMDSGIHRAVYSSFDFAEVNNNLARAGLMYEILRWMLSRKPVVENALLDGAPFESVYPGAMVTLTAVVNTTMTGGYNVAGANCTFGPLAWPGAPMAAQDGSFDSPVETATLTIDTTAAADGIYYLYVYGWDEVPNYNDTSQAYAILLVDSTPPDSNVVQTGSYWRSANPDAVTISATDNLYVPVLEENFDGGAFPPAGWSTAGICSAYTILPMLTHYWAQYDDAVIGVPISYSPPDCAGVWWSDGSGGDPPAGDQNEWLISPSIDASGLTNMQLTFWSVYTMMRYGAADGAHDYVRVSVDNGSSWTIVADLAHDAAFDFDGCSGGWIGNSSWNYYDFPISIDLSSYAGNPNVLVAWNYVYDSASPGGRGIWMVDDVSIQMSGVASVDLWYRYSADNATFGPWSLFGTSTLPPFDFAFDWPDGQGYYEFYSVATDLAGNTEAAPAGADAIYAYETTVPSSNVVQNAGYLNYGAGLTIDGTASDSPSGVDFVQLWSRVSNDNSTWSPWSLAMADYLAPYQWDFVAPQDGYYEFYSRAMDFAGNYEAAPGAADAAGAFDISPPTSNAVQGPQYAWNTGPMTVQAAADDMYVFLNEKFEGTFPPAGWSVDTLAGLGWERNDWWGDGNYVTGGGDYCADVNSDAYGTSLESVLYTPTLTFGGLPPSTPLYLEYDANFQCYITDDQGWTEISIDGGTSWTTLLYWNEDHPPGGTYVAPGVHVSIDISAYAGEPSVQFRFYYYAPDWDWYWQLDNVVIQVPQSVAQVELLYRSSLDNATWGAWTSFGNDSAAPYSWDFSWPDGDGFYELYTIATDNMGWAELPPLMADASYLYDTTAPTIASTLPADGNPSWSIAAGTYSIQFSELMNVLAGAPPNTNLPITGWAWDGAGMWLNGTYTALAVSTLYWVDLAGLGYTDAIGNALGGDTNKSFTTAAGPWAAVTSPSGPSVDTMPTILYDFGSSPTSVEIYNTSDGGATWTLWGTDATVDGTWTPGSSLSIDGPYYWSARALDGANDEPVPSSPVDIEHGPYILDTTSPSSSVDPVAPFWGNTIPTTFFATASDGLTSVAYVEFWYAYSADNITWGGLTMFDNDTAAPWSAPFTFPDGEGYYAFVSRAGDILGNYEGLPGTLDAECGYDITTPNSDAIYAAPYVKTLPTETIDANANDALSGVASVELWYRFSADNATWGSWTMFGTDTAAPWQWDFDWPMGVGYYQFYTVAHDIASNAEAPPALPDAEYQWFPPFPVSVVERTAAYWHNTNPAMITANVTVTANPVDYVELWYRFSSNNATWGSWAYGLNDTDGAPWQWSFGWPDGEGYYEFYSRAADTTGNYEPAPTSADAQYACDATVPASSVNAAGAYWRTSQPHTLTASASDGLSSVSYVELWYRYSANNATWGAWALFGNDTLVPWLWVFTCPDGDGFYEFASAAGDIVGNYEGAPSAADAAYGYDTAGPTSSCDVTGPYWYSSMPISISITATDGTSGVNRVQLWGRFSADNATWDGWWQMGTDFGAPWGLGVNFVNGTGYYEFYSIAIDLAGHVEGAPASADYGAAYETTIPSSSVDTIDPYWSATSPITITATAGDAGGSGLYNVTLYYAYSADNSTWPALNQYTMFSALAGGPWSWSFNFPNGAGYYRFYTLASDNASNQEAVPVVHDALCGYDNTVPASNANAISPYWYTVGPITITATAPADTYSGLYNVTLYYAYSADNTTWPALNEYTMFSALVGGPWSWSFNFPNGAGWYRFYTLASD
ncbi:MAG: hypothetical protein HZB92_00150, partial [Euryarchaeota archaeon]|nr:hypothetical protein [Euryarchaeota archaeon]